MLRTSSQGINGMDVEDVRTLIGDESWFVTGSAALADMCGRFGVEVRQSGKLFVLPYWFVEIWCASEDSEDCNELLRGIAKQANRVRSRKNAFNAAFRLAKLDGVRQLVQVFANEDQER